MRPFSVEVFFGERVAVLGSNGSGKSHFLRLLAGDEVAHRAGGSWAPGWCRAFRADPRASGAGRPLAAGDPVGRGHALQRHDAMRALAATSLQFCGDQRFETLSGGQQARSRSCSSNWPARPLLLLDEPTDNLDLASAEALEEALGGLPGHGDRGHP